jgi:hypothetical protein
MNAGVFYGADEIRTACAELGYWRWRHLQDSPALSAMPTKSANRLPGEARDRNGRPPREAVLAGSTALDRSRRLFTLQEFGRTAREAKVGAIRYESVRDPKHQACCAVLSAAAFGPSVPLEQQTWMLSVARDRVIWQRTHTLDAEEHEFAAAKWSPQWSPQWSPSAR